MTISQDPPYIKFKAVTIRAWHDRKPITKRITGHRNCQTLLALQSNLKYGITALEMSNWAYRLSAYIHDLGKKYELDIRPQTEPMMVESMLVTSCKHQ